MACTIKLCKVPLHILTLNVSSILQTVCMLANTQVNVCKLRKWYFISNNDPLSRARIYLGFVFQLPFHTTYETRLGNKQHRPEIFVGRYFQLVSNIQKLVFYSISVNYITKLSFLKCSNFNLSGLYKHCAQIHVHVFQHSLYLFIYAHVRWYIQDTCQYQHSYFVIHPHKSPEAQVVALRGGGHSTFFPK